MSALSLMFDDEFRLTTQQRTLVESLFAGLTKKQALVRAGYSEYYDLRKFFMEVPDAHAYANYLQQQEKKKWAVSREQVTEGVMEAIGLARSLEEPNTMINGWRELGKLHGLYAPEEKKVTLSAEKQEQVRQLEEASIEELLDLAGSDVIEGDFSLVDESK